MQPTNSLRYAYRAVALAGGSIAIVLLARGGKGESFTFFELFLLSIFFALTVLPYVCWVMLWPRVARLKTIWRKWLITFLGAIIFATENLLRYGSLYGSSHSTSSLGALLLPFATGTVMILVFSTAAYSNDRRSKHPANTGDRQREREKQ